ncbi:MAG: catD [Myxococcales bacterium]|nr:catD [Myxococcales bacterium]
MFVGDAGKGEAVLLLHGTPSPRADWAPVVDALSRRYRVLVPELPGYGASTPLENSSIEAVGDALYDMLRQRGVTAVAGVVGFSTGAYRAFDLVLRHPLAARHVISIAGVACFDAKARELRRSLARRLASEPSYLGSDEVRGIMQDTMLSPTWAAAHPDEVARVVAWRDLTNPTALARELEALAASRDLRPELKLLSARVYARVGELDVGCPPGWSEDIVRAAPHARLDRVVGCGHALLVEDAAATTAAIVAELG